MGIGSFLKSFVDPETLGDETIKTVAYTFQHDQKMYPGADPHLSLARAWLQRTAAKGHDITDPTVQAASFSETMLFACVPPPGCARALGLYFLYKENPHIIERFPKFRFEYEGMMAPVMQAAEEDNIEQLYRAFNPTMPR